jgi:murein DD-endopeptidase MepM/ murein hydrolase activator NlpD
LLVAIHLTMYNRYNSIYSFLLTWQLLIIGKMHLPRLIKNIIYIISFILAFSAAYFFPNKLLVKAEKPNAPTTLTLRLPFAVESRWTNFTPKKNAFVAGNSDTWFVYGWFGAIELNKTNANKYPALENRHQGIDFSAKEGTQVIAAADGIVYYTGDLYGRTVSIRHIEGYETVYGHLSTVDVIEGQKVRAGDLVGMVGRTGTVNPHLHFELRRYVEDGTWAINPRKLIKTDWTKVVVPDFPANRFFQPSLTDPDQQADFLLPKSYNIP